MGRRARPQNSGGKTSPPEKNLSWNGYARSRQIPNGPDGAELGRARETDAFPVLGRQLARFASRHDGEDADRRGELSRGETRSSCSGTSEPVARLSRFTAIWPGAISPWESSTGMVACGYS